MALKPPPLARVGLIGECMVELQTQADGQLVQRFGGDTLNAALYLRRLLPAAQPVEYLTALGDDPLSQAMRKAWREEGIDERRVRVLPGRLPGLYLIQTDPAGERRFLYWRGEAAARYGFDGPAADTLLAALGECAVLYLSGISLAILTGEGRERLLEALAAARRQGRCVVFDNNYRPTLWPDVATARDWHQRLLAMTDLALVTWDDDQALFGFADEQALLAAYTAQGVTEVAVKRGARACLLRHDGRDEEVPSERVAQVRDTTAAGDSFSAAYLACRLRGGDPVTAATWGHCLAAQVIQHPGALLPRAAMPIMPGIGR